MAINSRMAKYIMIESHKGMPFAVVMSELQLL